MELKNMQRKVPRQTSKLSREVEIENFSVLLQLSHLIFYFPSTLTKYLAPKNKKKTLIFSSIVRFL